MRLRDLWAREYPGQPFVLFGPPHLAAIALVIALNLAWAGLGPSVTVEARLAIRVAMAAILLINETVWHLWNWTTGQWTARTLLPFHLCSVMVYLSAFMLLTGNYLAYQFCYFFGIGGAAQALLTPDAGRYGFPHVRFFNTTVSHGLIISAALYMTLVEGYRPTWGSLLTVGAGMLLYAVLVAGVNVLLDSNYMYLMRPPDTPSLIDRLGPWPRYLGWLAVFALATMLTLYAPFAVLDWIRAR